MKITALILAVIILISTFFLVFTKKTLHAVFSLIILYVASALLVNYVFGLEFIGLLFILVYVGAVATLFVFMIMMMKLKTEEENSLSVENGTSALFTLNFARLFGIIWFLFVLFEPSIEIFNDFFTSYSSDALHKNLLLDSLKNSDLPNLLLSFTPWSDLFFLGFLLYSAYSFQLILIAYLLLAVLIAVMFLTGSSDRKSN